MSTSDDKSKQSESSVLDELLKTPQNGFYLKRKLSKGYDSKSEEDDFASEVKEFLEIKAKICAESEGKSEN